MPSRRSVRRATEAVHRRVATPPLRSLPLRRFSARDSGLVVRACLTRSACASRLSQPPDAFVRPAPTGLVSCRIRPWGCALQSFVPLRAAARRLRRRCPPGVGIGLRTPRRARLRGASTGKKDPSGVAREAALTFKALLRTRVRHYSAGCLGRLRARSSPGLPCPPGCSPPLERQGFRRASPPALRRWDASGPPAALQGLDSSGIGWSLARLPTLLGFAAS